MLGVGTLVFFMVRLIPGDVVDTMFADAEAWDPEVAARMRALFGLDKPLPVQFWDWLSAVLRGNLGYSLRTHTAVTTELASRMPATLELAIGALLIGAIIAIPAGVLSATRRNSFTDLAVRLIALFGLSMPNFWLGILLIYVLGVVLHVLPAGGYVPFLQNPLDSLKLGILPMITLGVGLAGITMRQTRSQMLEVLGEDFVRTSQAKGLGARLVTYRHALPNALIPVVTVVGLQLGRLLGGTVIIEQIFQWPGIGQLIFRAIDTRDYPMIQGSVLALAFFFVISNLLVDVLYIVVDPRLRHG
ncbi:MAG: ABC transporter permease [Chloroflexi bacterium]|nr:ABC transporter permease [Chloroflexota bacterium]